MTILLTERWPQTTDRARMALAAGPDDRAPDGRAPDGRPPDGRDAAGQETAQELLAEMAALIRDTRPSLVVSGSVAAAVLVGLATGSALLPLTGRGPGAVAAIALFALVAMCLLRTLTLIVLAGQPLAQSLSQQRVASGAPLDPRAPWASIPVPGTGPQAWTWARAHLLLSQARFRADRIQAATGWALVTAAVFLAWTSVVLLAR
ncbi:MAG TPA: hypothetical protein VH089_00615 [Streptosporangiaceae bacterium]|nr:hypothetical protein [Streptosporangiaceae bacterium]